MQRRSPRIVTKSQLAKEFLESKGFEVEEAVGVGLNSAQLMAAETAENPMQDRLEKDNIHLLYIGRLESRRNILFLLDVLEKLVAEDLRYRLVMVGKGDKAYTDKVWQTVSEKKLEPYIIYEESMAQNQLPYLYKNCDFFLLPTEYEIWGMVLMEAMKFNLPVITTYNGGSSSLVMQDINGVILGDDVECWSYVIKHNVFDKERIQFYNQNRLSNSCDWKIIAKKIIGYRIARK